MLSQYSWGQFFEVIAIALVLYYLYIGFAYYRNDLGSLFKRKGAGQLTGAAVGTTAAPPSLVRTTSAFAPVAAPAASAAQPTTAAVLQDEEGAAKNLPVPTVAVVAGALPDSTAAATGSDNNLDDAAPMDTAVLTASDEAALADEQRDIELDEADAELVKLLHQTQTAVVVPTTEPDEESVSEIPTNSDSVSQNLTTLANAESDTAYQALDYPEAEPLYLFDEAIASPLDARPIGVNQFIPASDILAFIQQVQAGIEPTSSVSLLATTNLPDRMKEVQQQISGELDALFS